MAVSHDRTSLLAVGAIASGGAAIIHAAAAGAHAEHTALARVFVVLAVAQPPQLPRAFSGTTDGHGRRWRR